MTQVIGAEHEFHEAEYAQNWAARFDPTPERLRLFAMMIGQVESQSLPAPHVVELGVGPGYFAARFLEAIAGVTYEGVDFSQPMLSIATERLKKFLGRMTFTRASLINDSWETQIKRPGAIVSTWTLHDLGSELHTFSVYQRCKSLLPPGGLLLNGDFIKPEGTSFDYEAGRFPAQRHLEMLSNLGFRNVECLGIFETELE